MTTVFTILWIIATAALTVCAGLSLAAARRAVEERDMLADEVEQADERATFQLQRAVAAEVDVKHLRHELADARRCLEAALTPTTEEWVLRHSSAGRGGES